MWVKILGYFKDVNLRKILVFSYTLPPLRFSDDEKQIMVIPYAVKL